MLGDGGYTRRRIQRSNVGDFQRRSEVIRRALVQIGVLHLILCQPDLAIGWQLHIVRHMQVFQNLLCDALKHRRGDLAALVQPDRRIEDDRDCHGGIVDGGEACKRTHVFCP